MVTYRHTALNETPPHGGVNLVSVRVPLDAQWLDERVDALMGEFSHALHLNFVHHVVPKGYTRAISLGGARKRVQYLLQRLRTETYRLWQDESFAPAKSDRKRLSHVRGAIEFGTENLGIHAHLLANFHPSITQDWIAEAWAADGASCVLHSLAEASPEEQRRAIAYVESRALQYALVAGQTHEALSLNDYDEHLVIDGIDGYQKHERHHGRTTHSPRYRSQHLTY